LLRSPAPGAGACTRASTHKPLPSPPRSVSVPSTPVELPGSILLENQGFPSAVAVEDPTLLAPLAQNIRRSTHPPNASLERDDGPVDLLSILPGPLSHARSAPDLAQRHSEMRSVRSGNALNTAALPSPLKVQRKKSLSDASSRKRSKPNLVTSPTSADYKGITRSIPTSRESRTISTNARTGAGKLSQPPPPIVEGETWTEDAAQSESRRHEVRFVCFFGLVCLFVEREFVHNETVSERLSLLHSNCFKTYHARDISVAGDFRTLGVVHPLFLVPLHT
jgi:hypothetical protein